VGATHGRWSGQDHAGKGSSRLPIAASDQRALRTHRLALGLEQRRVVVARALTRVDTGIASSPSAGHGRGSASPPNGAEGRVLEPPGVS